MIAEWRGAIPVNAPAARYKSGTNHKTEEQEGSEKIMTKAERIYQSTRAECIQHISDWGYKPNIGFNGLIYKDTESVSQRTVNAVKTILERKQKDLVRDEKLGILTVERKERESQILSMIEITLNNQQKNIDDFKQSLKEL